MKQIQPGALYVNPLDIAAITGPCYGPDTEIHLKTGKTIRVGGMSAEKVHSALFEAPRSDMGTKRLDLIGSLCRTERDDPWSKETEKLANDILYIIEYGLERPK